MTLRERAAEFAKETVAKQSASFQRYGIFGDFENPYLTLQPEFEAAQIRVFGEMFKKGHLYRGRKPVHWSPSSRTALAEAELEYPDNHFSRSIYVGFPISSATPALSSHADAKVAIWTTTPWTMPANLAVAVNPDLEYSVVAHPTTGKLIVATDLAEKLASTLKLPEDSPSFKTLLTLKGSDLVGTTYSHPLYDRVSPVLAGGDYITTESGTGLVHTAPGHGQEDYLTGMKNGLELLSPVDDAGRFTAEAGERFVGKDVLGDGNIEAITALEEAGALLMEEKVRGGEQAYTERTLNYSITNHPAHSISTSTRMTGAPRSPRSSGPPPSGFAPWTASRTLPWTPSTPWSGSRRSGRTGSPASCRGDRTGAFPGRGAGAFRSPCFTTTAGRRL